MRESRRWVEITTHCDWCKTTEVVTAPTDADLYLCRKCFDTRDAAIAAARLVMSGVAK